MRKSLVWGAVRCALFFAGSAGVLSAQSYKDMKTIQDLHMEIGYSPKVLYREYVQKEPAYNDIGYHFGIAPDGTIYAGRPLDVKGSHVKDDNTGNIGIVLLDSYRGGGELPTPMADSLKNLMQYLEIQYPDIGTNIDTHGGRNQTVNNGKDTSEASEALPVIHEEQNQVQEQADSEE